MMIKMRIAESKKCNGDYSLFTSFPYNEKLVNLVRELSDRNWDKEKKEWEIPYRELANLLPELKDYDIEITGDIDALTREPADVCTMVEGFTFKTKPFKHQEEGFVYGINHDRWLLGDEQGLGKTKQVIDIAVAKKIQLGYNKCLIICGVNGLKWNWRNEVLTHSNEQPWILGQKTKKNGELTVGSNKDKLKDLENINSIPAYFIITNVESLRDEDIRDEISALCKDGTINMVAIDEIHKCKNPSSQQGKGILKVQPEYRVAMTGTPLLNTPVDLYIVLKWLGLEKHSFFAFKNHYCVYGGFGGYEIVAYKNLGELREVLDTMMLRRLKEDVLDLPEKIYIDEFVEMTGKQEQVYKEVHNELKAMIDKIQIANNPLAELIRLRQATGYTGILSSTILESAKIDRLEELVEESVANDRKVVIFSNWTQITHPVYQRLSLKYDGIVITGETADADRQRFVDRFQTDENCKFALGTTGAMGTGITLTAGTVVIFMDEPWTMANKQQAIDRCHRIGTTSNITIYTIMCKGTIDERIHSLVEKKGLMADALIDGKIVGNKLELLNFLLG